jgi:hypothetical protein
MAKFRYEWFLFDYKKGYPDRISNGATSPDFWVCATVMVAITSEPNKNSKRITAPHDSCH